MHRLTRWTPELEALIHSEARAVGFSLSGVAGAVPSGESSKSDSQRFAAWVEDGRAGEMEYLKRRDPSGAYLRSTLQTAIPWAQSILVCAFNYNAAAPRSIDPASPITGWIARYAWSGRSPEPDLVDPGKGSAPAELVPTDYHNELLGRLRQLEASLHAHADCETRCYVDTGPILERAFAARAGVGCVGKKH